jgi:hypothetical protein
MIALFPVLRQRIKQTNISWTEAAAVAGVSPFEFHLKMWGIKGWTLADAVRLCAFFRTPDVEHLFVRNYYKQQFLESQGKNNHV